jgi:nucleoside-diphosphate-sugar epimerase
MKKTLVVGGSGFIGSTLQRVVLDRKQIGSFVFSFNQKREKLDPKLENLKIDLLEEVSHKVNDYPVAIYVAGNANHGIAKRDPLLDLNLNVRAFLNFTKEYRGSLVLLSSQAVYYGLEGEVPEEVDHVSTIPYGISKLATEAYAKYLHQTGVLPKLWIIRLAYAFGHGEKENRLIPRCATAVRDGEKVTVFGGGTSFVNPLPVEFVAEILLKAADSLKDAKEGFMEITNLNSPERFTIKNIVTRLSQTESFDFTINASGEEWPVKFWGSTKNLSDHLEDWNMEFPDSWATLKKYFIELIKRRKE